VISNTNWTRSTS